MMYVEHPTANRKLGAPKGDENRVGSLPIRDEFLGNSTPAVVSFWKPTAEELQVLNAGGVVTLWIMGFTMPPAMIGVESME